MRIVILVLFLFRCFSGLGSLHLPEYIKSCKIKDANFKNCAIKSGNDAIKILMKGDRKYNIPFADPLLFPKATVVGDNINLNSSNINIYGLLDLNVTDVDVNLEKNVILFEIHIPLLTITCDYSIKGKISAFIIDGKGPGVVKIYDCYYRSGFGFSISERNGKRYMNLGNETFEFKPQKMTFEFDNLFNGDKNLGNLLTNYLNDNWKDVVEALGPSLKQIGVTLGKLIVDTMLQKVPVDEIFPDF